MTRLLVSVRSLEEAHLAAEADLLDLKEPAAGALGALPLATIHRVRQSFANRRMSATVGDLLLCPQSVSQAAEQIASTGVDYVKIGLFAGDLTATLAALAKLTTQTALVAVLFADQPWEFSVLPALARAGFAGVMLDTADKRRGSLLELCSPEYVESFVRATRSLGLMVGLAGSLQLQDIPKLLPLEPDYLGFRGALCRGGRTGALDPELVAQARRALA